MVLNRIICVAAYAALPAGFPMPLAAADLYEIVAPNAAARSAGTLVSPVAVRVDFRALAAAHEGSTFDVRLPSGKSVTVRIDKLVRHANGDVSWTGKTLDAERVDLSAVGTSGVSGTYAELQTSQGTWGIVPSNAGHEWLFDKAATESNASHPWGNDIRVPPTQEKTR
jgi:hypothetical protein